MQIACRIRYLLLAASIVGGVDAAEQSTRSPAQQKEQADDAAGFKEFSARVQDYVRVHKTADSSLPALKTTDLPEILAAHQQALARKIREARPNAKRGDIFTPQAAAAFRQAIRELFKGPDAPHAQATIKQGDPVKEVHLEINQVYPDTLPFTTVPPTLLLKLPKLPDPVAFRLVGSDLILLDVQANLVVDSIEGVIPQP